MAIAVHKTSRMVTEYTPDADQRTRAKAAILKLERTSANLAAKYWRALGESNPSCKIENLES